MIDMKEKSPLQISVAMVMSVSNSHAADKMDNQPGKSGGMAVWKLTLSMESSNFLPLGREQR
jgi:hypothetical protein